MSELEDKPEPDQEAEGAKQGAGSGSEPKSKVESGWDALLGSASSSASRPIFAPPGAAKRAASGPVPDAVPRTSRTGASVSGEFEVAEPRPEPATPPRYEPPEGITIEDDLAASAPSLSQSGLETQDDDDRETPNDPPVVLKLVGSDDFPEPAADPEPSPVVERPRARAPEADPIPDPEPQDKGARGLLFVIGAIAVISVIIAIVLIGNGRDHDQPVASKTEQPATERASERPAPDQPGPGKIEAISGTETGPGETGSEADHGETGGEVEVKPRPSTVDPRDLSLIPPGTPEENAKAFIKLPVSIHDGPPVGGIGRSGIHIDSIATARGRDNTSCDDPTRSFSVSVAEYVNVCFRVVHPREQEWLRVIWEKDGKVTRRGRVRIPDLHAYTTRAYLLVRPEYVGRWRVRIVPEGEDGIDLAVAEFEITE
ncbi:MAG TPA: hypothetical protein VK034_31500 [Enhygromyxa sp.]|nr:hypothetical protein [Enhygromyxa sp.]